MSQEPELAIKINGEWHDIDWNIFRSWTGPRRIDGKPFHGVRFELGTDITGRSVMTDVCDSCAKDFQHWPQGSADTPSICPECAAASQDA